MSGRKLMVPVLAVLLCVGCKSPTGVDKDTEEFSRLVVEATSHTVRLVEDTVQLEALLLNAVGEVVGGAEVAWSSSDSTVLAVSDEGVVTYPADTTYSLKPEHREGVPSSPGPKAVTITAEGNGALGSIELTARSPIRWVNVHPDGVCMSTNASPLEAWVEARDIIGRKEAVEGPEWENSDASVAQMTVQSDDRKVKVNPQAEGTTDVRATVAGLTDTLEVLVSSRRDQSGRVNCDHLF